MVGGNWTGQYSGTRRQHSLPAWEPTTSSGQNTLFVGGIEFVGVNGTGTFTQNGGSNEIVGGGNYRVHSRYQL